MGKPEGLEEVESVLRKHCRNWGTRSRDREPELEVVPEVDVEMTLQ